MRKKIQMVKIKIKYDIRDTKSVYYVLNSLDTHIIEGRSWVLSGEVTFLVQDVEKQTEVLLYLNDLSDYGVSVESSKIVGGRKLRKLLSK